MSTAPVVQRTAPIAPQARPRVDIVREAEQLRSALEDSYSRISARANGTPATTIVDADATLSMDIPDHRTIRGAISYFSTDLHDSIQVSLQRSARFKPMIDRILAEYRLPRGLAYLPVIESAYVTTLTSRSGAHGIWQFMPDTAREYGLRVDWWVDERADAEKETRAAAAYLHDLYATFGDWSLALAAYNAGPGRVQRALSNTGSSSFWQLSDSGALPKETRGYVPTFFATLVIVSDPPTYGFTLLEGGTEDDDARVEVEGPVTLDYLAEVAEVDLSAIREMNPQYRHGVLPPGRSLIRLPRKSASLVAERAATLRLEDPNLPVATFTMREGDTLRSIARSIGATSEEIAAMNGSARESLHVGQTLYLPVRQRELSSLLRHEGSSTAGASRYYTVERGDTLYSIARRHGLSVEELTDLNQFPSDHVLRPGQQLRVSLGTIATGGM
jgi:membrane-bound lytic murein transglycosylase D